ncbi:MAG: hypothetical protein ACRDTE_33650 [Pseudonocardiaceae bacterium]
MWPQPDDPGVVQLMRHAHRQARTTLGVAPDRDSHEAWGWRGRTLSQPVAAPDGPAWLRVARAPIGQIVNTFWDGSRAAEQSIPDSIPRPRLRTWHDWNDETWEYRAELYDRVPYHPIATSPSLEAVPDLPSSWWTALRTALDDISTVPTRRVTIKQTFTDQVMPRFLGDAINTTAPSWSTAHGDLHWANLSGPTLHMFDWEGWGLAPTGYDVATLHSYSLLVPALAARIRTEFAHVLDTHAGRHAELVVIAELLQSTTRSNNLNLANALRNRAREIISHWPTPK